YSVPSFGGWLFVAAGVLMLVGVLIERNVFMRSTKKIQNPVLATLLILFITSCGNPQPQPIKLNSDACDYCKMTISDARFASELVTKKGRVYKFDDITCMVNYTKENTKVNGSVNFISDYT